MVSYLDIFSDEWMAEQIDNDYCHKLTGAGSGTIDPSGIAKYYADMKDLSHSDIMAYCFRRFGYPIYGWDSYKKLCHWFIKTPMQDVFLSVSATRVSPFGFMLRSGIYNQLVREPRREMAAWGDRCFDWAKKKYGVTLIGYAHWSGSAKFEDVEKAFTEWITERYPDDPDLNEKSEKEISKIGDLFWKVKGEECEYFERMYKINHPSPVRRSEDSYLDYYDRKVPEIPYWRNLHKDSLERNIMEALWRTIVDLKRPVSIRDWEINIEGICDPGEYSKWNEGTDEVEYDYTVPSADTSGYGVIHKDCRVTVIYGE